VARARPTRKTWFPASRTSRPSTGRLIPNSCRMREAGTGSPVASRARRSAGVAEGGRAIGERFLYDYGTISVLGGFVDPRPARGVREELMLFLYDLIPSGSHVCRAWPSAITNHHSTSDENESPSTLRLPLPASPVG